MAQQAKDARLKLGEPVASLLKDFCSANYNCPQIEVIREAVETHIKSRLSKEPALRERFEEVRRARLGASDVAVLIPRGGASSGD